MISLKNKLYKKLAHLGLISILSYPLFIGTIAEVRQLTFPRINIEQAEQLIQKEKQKLGIKQDFKLHIYKDNSLPNIYGSVMNNDDHFSIYTSKKNLTELIIKHEMYHASREEIEVSQEIPAQKFVEEHSGKDREVTLSLLNLIKVLKYFYIIEPRANVYTITGIRL